MENKKNNKNLIILIVLLLIALISLSVTIAMILIGGKKTSILPPDYAPVETEKNMETIGGEGTDKLPQPDGGGAVSITYSNKVTIDLSEKTASVLLANPKRSNQDMVVQLIIQDSLIVQTGRLTPGNRVTKLDLEDGAEKLLSEGGYEGEFRIFYYDPESGEKAVINTAIPVTVTVAK